MKIVNHAQRVWNADGVYRKRNAFAEITSVLYIAFAISMISNTALARVAPDSLIAM
jgi:hypothetical protein